MLKVLNKSKQIKNNKYYKGFTLIELLVVIGIISTLITMSVLTMQRYQAKAVDTRIKADLSHVRNIAAMVYSDNSNYNYLCDADNTLDQNNPYYSGLKSIEEDINKFTEQDPICYAAGLDFCVQTILTLEGNFCVDATGYAGETETHCGEGAGANKNKKCSAP